MPLHAYRVDAFTTTPGQGNAAGVVTDAAGLDPAQMQAIAAELGCSETAFVLPASGPDHDLQLRFFTPTVEVPVCGHATIAAHFVLASASGHTGVIHQLSGAGVQRIETVRDDQGIAVRIRQNRPEFREPLAPELVPEVMAALGVGITDLDFRCPLQFVSTGHGKLLLGIERRDRLRELRPDFAQLAELSPLVGSNGYYVFTLDSADDDDALCHGRMFAPAIGIEEDPVTGNANGPLGAYLVRHGLLLTVGGFTRFRARQQAANGRGGFVDVSVRAEGDIPVEVEIEGRAVMGPQVALTSIR
ncbi:PhzF family phenazine biosynthesis isomerase [Montanilutibacter psychrotolerans]|uniref:PhzF family phenazine biosynthesis isomerase n=1 Tax=Montanilutibacter psychrotolerans TaxID=1327343 RepID=A0A3M8SSA6_9GAMM|nr:PhzF family phenazine biosynthesis isomerase [Lysobacter psychrotolerans]RNF84231.1 PhzF family phenazine biosynthesis isomerase [Lysobacter psychrotolerans]